MKHGAAFCSQGSYTDLSALFALKQTSGLAFVCIVCGFPPDSQHEGFKERRVIRWVKQTVSNILSEPCNGPLAVSSGELGTDWIS